MGSAQHHHHAAHSHRVGENERRGGGFLVRKHTPLCPKRSAVGCSGPTGGLLRVKSIIISADAAFYFQDPDGNLIEIITRPYGDAA